jgi:hypothetical protein
MKNLINADFAKDILKKLSSFNWRSLQKYANPKAADDLNAFLEKLPQNSGKTVLMAAAIAWGVAGAVGLYATVQFQKVTDLRAALSEAEALKPIVPIVKNTAVKNEDLAPFIDKTKKIYPGLDVSARDNIISISAKSTSSFGQFREAIGHVHNGGVGWQIGIKSLCIGRECKNNPLSVDSSVNKVSVDKPE